MIASGPISYLFNAPDWVRYLPSRTPSAAIFWTVFLASGVIALFLSVMGVLLASRGDMSDPVGGVEPFVPRWLYVLYILAAVGGSIANNVVAYYSSGLCLQSAGLPLRRYQATALDTVVSTAMVLYILLVQDFTTVLHHFVALLVVWLGPFAAVWMTDGLMRRWRYDPEEIHDVGPTGAYWGWHGINPRGWIALLAGVGVCLLTINAPILHGPVSDALARSRPHLDRRAAGERGHLLGARARDGWAVRAGAAPWRARPRPRACRRRACGRSRARGS